MFNSTNCPMDKELSNRFCVKQLGHKQNELICQPCTTTLSVKSETSAVAMVTPAEGPSLPMPPAGK